MMSFYSENAQSYANSTFDEKFSKAIFSQLGDLFETGNAQKVLDIGFGSGRDALYLTKKGFEVEAFDLEPKMVEEAKLLTGLDNVFNQGSAESFKTDSRFDLAYSVACLLHLNDEQFLSALENIKAHLNVGGKFFFTLKAGVGEDIDGMQRYFNYYSKEKIESILNKLNLNIIYFSSQEDLTRPDTIWHSIVVKKI